MRVRRCALIHLTKEWTMSNQTERHARRRFLEIAAVAVVTLPMAAMLLPQSGFAADLPHLDTNDATAKALAYTEDAATAKTNAAFKPDSDCANCQFFQGTAKDAYAPCTLFPAKAVHAKGWCAGYSRKA
jgi:hypothetical protein